MRLLFDQNLSFKLCSRLAGLFPDSSQVRLLGLSEADDRVVWEHAKANGFTWFRRIRISPTLRHWSARHPKSSGYALNKPTNAVEHALRDHADAIKAFEQDNTAVCLEIY